jgi:hypothetical protein
MRHLTLSTALLASCLIAGAAWAQGSSGGSSGGGSSGGGAGSGASPSTAPSTSRGTATQPSGTAIRPPVQGTQGNAGQTGTTNTTNNPTGTTASTPNTGSDTTGDAATGSFIRPPGNEGSTGGTAASSNQSSTDPATTGGVSGNNRLQPGERSAVGPTPREEELFRQGEQVEQKARQGICQGCED